MSAMNDAVLRSYRPDDIPELTALWVETFGDDAALIGSFLRLLPELGTAVVAECGGKVVGAAYALIAGELRGADESSPLCGYIYAVAVDAAYRHKGLGAALVKGAAEAARRLGAELICTLPAEASLYGWYEELLGVRAALHTVTHSEKSAPLIPCTRLSAAEYMRRREALLQNRERLCPTAATVELTRCLCETYGGGLFACGELICAAYVEDGVCLIRELVFENEEDCADAAASVGAMLGTLYCRYRLPSAEGDEYIAADPGRLSPDCVWNLSFD